MKVADLKPAMIAVLTLMWLEQGDTWNFSEEAPKTCTGAAQMQRRPGLYQSARRPGIDMLCSYSWSSWRCRL